jgi:hypothetical protein
MAKTGFYDDNQRIYLPKDTLTWTDLNTSPYATWDNWTSWYQNLSASTTLEFTTDIIDFGRSAKVTPTVILRTGLDGETGTAMTFDSSNEDKPAITIEGSNNSDMSSATSVTLTRTSSPTFSSVGAKRYYRVTVNINSGTNAAPNGIIGIQVSLDTTEVTETIQEFNTATVDDGSTANRTIPTGNTYSDITYVGITPRTNVSDTNVTGTSSSGNYVQLDYYAEGYTVQSGGSVTTAAVTMPPLSQLVSTSTNSFVISLFEANSGDDTNATVDCHVRGLQGTVISADGNLE